MCWHMIAGAITYKYPIYAERLMASIKNNVYVKPKLIKTATNLFQVQVFIIIFLIN